MEELERFIEELKSVPASELKKYFDKHYQRLSSHYINKNVYEPRAYSNLAELGDFWDHGIRREHWSDELWSKLSGFGVHLIESGVWKPEVRDLWNKL